MRKYETAEILPLKMINSFENHYPGCWNMIGFKLADIKNNAINYDLYLKQIAGVLEKYCIQDEEHLFSTFCIMLTAAAWRKNKQVFCFDQEILNEFCNQKTNFDISLEIFEQLPYPCIYIAVDGFNGLDGIWVMKGSDNLGNKVLWIDLCASCNDIAVYHFNLNDFNNINDIIKSAIDDTKLSKISKKKKRNLREQLKIALQCLLYICAANAVIEEDPVQKERYHAPTSEEFIKDKVREVKKWNCGKKKSNIIYSDFGSNRIVLNMRENHKRNVKSSPKRCHVRRSHWHHYWTGSSKDGTRKMVLKWISTMTIHKEEYEGEFPNIRINNVCVS